LKILKKRYYNFFMKIVLLSESRSGSTSLAKCIIEHLKTTNFVTFIEPFNIGVNNLLEFKKLGYDFNKIDDLINIENLFIKSILMHGKPNYPKDNFKSNKEYCDWMTNFFDKIILLSRKDKVAQSESFIINEKVNITHGLDWHTPKIYKTNKIDQKVLNDKIEQYNKTQNILKNMSESGKYPIFYYEDIFVKCDIDIINKIFQYIDLKPNWDIIEKWIISNDLVVRIDYTNDTKLI